jgi:hypothetical protein
MKQLFSLLLSVFIFAPAAFAGTTGYFTIHEIDSGFSATDVYIIKGDFASIGDTCSTNDDSLLLDMHDASNHNAPGIEKMLLSAFLAGKKVTALWTTNSCISGYVAVRQLYVCSDSSC